MCHFKVDVIAGDANAAAYKYYKGQEYPDLCDSSVAVMLREMQREVNTGYPSESRLRIDYSTNNHPPQLHGANDLDCCFYGYSLMGKTGRPRIMRKRWSNIAKGQSAKLREQTGDKDGETDRRHFA